MKNLRPNYANTIVRRTAALKSEFNNELQAVERNWLNRANAHLSTLLDNMFRMNQLLVDQIEKLSARPTTTPAEMAAAVQSTLKAQRALMRDVSDQFNLSAGRPTQITASVHASVKNVEEMSEEELDAALHRTLKHLGWVRREPAPVIDIDHDNGAN